MFGPIVNKKTIRLTSQAFFRAKFPSRSEWISECLFSFYSYAIHRETLAGKALRNKPLQVSLYPFILLLKQVNLVIIFNAW